MRKSLSRLEKEKVIERLSNGIYLYPKQHPTLGTLYPATEEIASLIAIRDKARIIPTGPAAIHKLGLSTQLPMNLTYLTDGAPRKIKIGKQRITFKSTTAKKLSAKSQTITLVIQALQHLGKDAINNHIIDKIRPLLRSEDPKTVEHDIQSAPVWIRELIKATIKNTQPT